MNKAKPQQWNLMSRPAYKPKGQLADNLERSAELYPHRLIGQGGVGVGTERKHGYSRGR